MPSLTHFCRDLCSDSTSTPLHSDVLALVPEQIGRTATYLSDIVWNSFEERFSGWGSLSVGNGAPAVIDLGRGFSTTGGGCGGGVGAADGAGVLSGGVEFRFLFAGSERDPLAGSFLFLSILSD
jgi:hypothetical protein